MTGRETMDHEPSIADVLRAAARLIRDRGLTRGRFMDDDGAICSVGGICLAIRELCGASVVEAVLHLADSIEEAALRRQTLDYFLEFLRRHQGDPDLWSVPTWSDLVARDEVEVAEAMEKAAAQHEELYG